MPMVVAEAAGTPGHRPSEAKAHSAVPELGGTSRGAEIPPAGRPTPAFILLVHPNRWTIIHNSVCPLAKKLKLVGGVDGVDEINGKPKPGLALESWKEQGWIELPWTIDGESYLKKVDSNGAWITRWETLHPGSERVTSDQAGFAEFYDKLQAKGVIPAPPVWYLDEMAARIAAEIEDDKARYPLQETTIRQTTLKHHLEVVRKRRAQILEGLPDAAASSAVPDVG